MNENLENEKILALESKDLNSHNPGYNVERKSLDKMNNSMANISHLPKNQIKENNGIKTKIRTRKEARIIWQTFLKKYAVDFEAYMGYGINEIKKIGWREFIDFMDWREKEDIPRYRTDRVKVIPCQHCGNHFTTFQIDFGLCNQCKKIYNLKHFGEVCQYSDQVDAGSSGALVIAFAYMDEFRKMYRNDLPLKEKIEMAGQLDDFSGLYTLKLLESIISENKADEFLKITDETLITQKAINKYESIKTILLSYDSNELKLKRLKDIF